MAKLNLYKIPQYKRESLLDKFKEIGLTLLTTTTKQNFNLDFYYPSNTCQISKGVWWGKLYKDFLKNKNPQSVSPFACLLIYNTDILYANSLGKTHFYLNSFCDYNFGIDIGTRIINEKSTDMKNSRFFGGLEKSSITSYIANTKIDFDSAESISFLKGDSINKELYGTKVQCGISLSLNIKDFSPSCFPKLINNIEKELKKEPLFEIPTSHKISDLDIVSKLDQKLLKLINDEKTLICINETQLSGVDFIFHKDDKLTFRYKKHRLELTDNQSIIQIKDFLEKQNILVNVDVINYSKIIVKTNTDLEYQKPFKYFIDYVDEQRFYLNGGVWFQFNQLYLEFLKKRVEQIPFEIKDASYNFDTKKFKYFKNELSNTTKNEGDSNRSDDKYWYSEKYFNFFQSKDKGFINIDRTRTYFDIYNIEIADLYKDDALYIVKIGVPQKFNYAIDQANTAIQYLAEHEKKVILDNGKEVSPKKIVLWFILDRLPIKKLTDLHSLTFQIKLATWYKNVKKYDFEPNVWISYKR